MFNFFKEKGEEIKFTNTLSNVVRSSEALLFQLEKERGEYGQNSSTYILMENVRLTIHKTVKDLKETLKEEGKSFKILNEELEEFKKIDCKIIKTAKEKIFELLVSRQWKEGREIISRRVNKLFQSGGKGKELLELERVSSEIEFLKDKSVISENVT